MRSVITAISAGVLVVSLFGSSVWAVAFPDQTQVNLFRQYNRVTGAMLTQITNYSQIIDGSYSGTQIDPPTPSMNFDVTLSTVRNASKLVLDYTGYQPGSYSISYSATGFSGMTPLAVNIPDTNTDHYEYVFPGGDDGAPVRYLRFTQNAGGDGYIRIGEFQLKGAKNNTLDDFTDGYNLLANRSNVTPITSYHSEEPNVGIDNNPMTGWVRPLVTPLPDWFVIPLTRSITLWGVNLGFYDNWGNTSIDVSNALAMPDPTLPAGWTSVYVNSSGYQGPAFIKFAETDARWVRVTFSGGNALSELELYGAIPEPATGVALLLGCALLARRRSQSAAA